ncbi:hypothetical protein TSO352_29920 [Azospirillum sp. TSO35-2]|nr:hypothetical protein TSO352_29920 [Azospirillum sp. TSO35-2]
MRPTVASKRVASSSTAARLSAAAWAAAVRLSCSIWWLRRMFALKTSRVRAMPPISSRRPRSGTSASRSCSASRSITPCTRDSGPVTLRATAQPSSRARPDSPATTSPNTVIMPAKAERRSSV